MKHNFRNLKAWQLGMEVVKRVYTVTAKFPEEEKFGLTLQARKSAVSIPSNIAEGTSRESNKDFVRFLRISLGSSFELTTQMLVALDQKYLTQEMLDYVFEANTEAQRVLNGLINKNS